MHFNAIEDTWEISREDIEVGNKLGQGNYGTVFRGRLSLKAMTPGIYAHKQEMEFEGKSHLNVAVKMLRRKCAHHCHCPTHYVGMECNSI